MPWKSQGGGGSGGPWGGGSGGGGGGPWGGGPVGGGGPGGPRPPDFEDFIRKGQDRFRRMMPGGPLSNSQLSNLRIYAGTDHPHEAQQPEVVDVAALNAKNKFRG